MLLTILSLIPFYLIGTFPTGSLIARYQGVDLTSQGSGNVGATNVTRVIGKGAGLLTMCIDALKGLLAVYLGTLFTHNNLFPVLCGVVVVAGHCFPIPLKLHGGKGVATTLGVLFYLAPMAAVIGVITFLSVALTTRIISLSSLTAAAAITGYALLGELSSDLTYAIVCIALIVVIKHRENIVRLLKREEKKVGCPSKSTST